jgi:osmotically-inducible protein OsmY
MDAQHLERGFRRRSTTGSIGLFLIGLGTGVALTYYFDPRLGSRRRGLTHDRTLSLMSHTKSLTMKRLKHVRNQILGAVSQVANLVRPEEPPTDEVLKARIRATLGRILEHPRQVDIATQAGHVTIMGTLRTGEIDTVLTAIRAVRGVSSVEDKTTREQLHAKSS